jgi:glycosyltransferase involved in cell wall biosynthesis
MMCGTPVIAFNRGSMAVIIVDGHTGFLVSNISEAVKAIEKKLDQIDSQICRDYATVKFSADRMIDEYINVYTEILDDRKSQ